MTKKPKQAPAPQSTVPVRRDGEALYWLLKSEPDAWSWQQQLKRGVKGEVWSGVRNYQARNNMRAMLRGDRGFFYHSNEGKEIVGIVEVIETVRPDPTDDSGKWDIVVVKAVAPLPRPISLDEIKTVPELADMVLVNNSRLSVQPVTAAEWQKICQITGFGESGRR